MVMPAKESVLHEQLDTLYSDHYGWLFGWLRKKLGCRQHAADVVQDTFLRILTSRDNLQNINEPRAFLTTTAKHLLIDQARRDKIEKAYLAELATLAEAQDACHPSAEQLSAVIEALEQLSRMLQGVSAKARDVFLMHYLEGHKQQDIAKALGISERMVRKYLVQVLLHCQTMQAF